MGRSVLLLVNRHKPGAVQALDEVRRLIAAHGVLADEQEANGEPIGSVGPADLIVVLGGDGTILAQARRCAHLDVPMVGINFGNLGYLAEFDFAAFRRQAASLIGNGKLTLSRRAFLQASILSDGEAAPRFVGLGLNDAVITAGPPYRMIELELTINGESGPTIRGDGVIVSTAIGSTGYNVSAGGPLISPELESLSVTPIAAHSLSFRPVVLPGSAVVELDVRRANRTESGGTTLVLDGQVDEPTVQGDRIRIERSERSIQLVRNAESTYWRTLMRKLHWAASPSADG